MPWVSGLKDHDGSRGGPGARAGRRTGGAVRHLVDTGDIVSAYVEWMMLRPEHILTLRVRSRDTGVVMA